MRKRILPGQFGCEIDGRASLASELEVLLAQNLKRFAPRQNVINNFE